MADPNWAAATIAYAKDTVALEEAEKKLSRANRGPTKEQEAIDKANGGRGANEDE